MVIAVATYAGLPGSDDDFPALRAALDRLGMAAEPVVWDDPSADWDRYDLVVVRSTWDYTLRLAEFMAWAERVPRLVNPVEVLRWNTDKCYLRELAAAGVPVVPTVWDPADLPAEPGWEQYVIKPAISAGAADTARWGPGEEEAARAHLRRLTGEGRTVMVQPYLSAVDTAGETALIFIEGEFSHATRKAAILTPGSGVQGPIGYDCDPRKQIHPAEATPAELAAARRALAAAPGGDQLLYARVDLIPGPDGDPVLLELELAEPSLFLRLAPGSAERLAVAIAGRAETGR